MANSESTETNQPGLGVGVPIDRPVRSEVADGTAVAATGPGRPHDAREAAPRADAEQDAPAQVWATELNALRETLQFAARAPTQISAAPAEAAEATTMRLQQTQAELTAALRAAQPLPVRMGLEHTRGSYKGVARLFNLEAHDYKRLLNFLRKHDCQLPFRDYR